LRERVCWRHHRISPPLTTAMAVFDEQETLSKTTRKRGLADEDDD
jgi:hypothetical protein